MYKKRSHRVSYLINGFIAKTASPYCPVPAVLLKHLHEKGRTTRLTEHVTTLLRGAPRLSPALGSAPVRAGPACNGVGQL